MDSTVDVDDILSSPTTDFGRVVVLTTVALMCKATMHFMNRTTVRNPGAVETLMHREDGRPLITVANHTSTVDDPCLTCAMLPLSFFTHEANHRGNRWVFCAKDVCFTNPIYRLFFQSGKTVPVERGGGIEQPNLQVLAKHIAVTGGWLHVFPEGRISYDGKLSDLRWGVGRVVCDSMLHGDGRSPIVLPYYHSGMASVMPYKARFPRIGHNVTVTFGEPLELDDVTCKCNKRGVPQEQVWREITARVQASLKDLEERSIANVDQTKDGSAPGKHVRGHGGRPISLEPDSVL